jgi:hypothetical protein
MINYKLLYNRIFTSEKFTFSKDILFVSNNNSYNEIKLYNKILFDDIIDKTYHTIIIIDLFSLYQEDDIKNKIDYYKTFTKKNGKIIFIEQLLTTDNYQLLTMIRHIFYPLMPFIGKNTKMTYMYDIIKEMELYIVDSDRIYSDDIMYSSIEYFSIICEKK